MRRNNDWTLLLIPVAVILGFVLWMLLHKYTDHIWSCRQSMGVYGAVAVAAIIGTRAGLYARRLILRKPQ
jgi:lipoprotein signal peptidase